MKKWKIKCRLFRWSGKLLLSKDSKLCSKIWKKQKKKREAWAKCLTRRKDLFSPQKLNVCKNNFTSSNQTLDLAKSGKRTPVSFLSLLQQLWGTVRKSTVHFRIIFLFFNISSSDVPRAIKFFSFFSLFFLLNILSSGFSFLLLLL